MQSVTERHEVSKKSLVSFLPIIDLNPSDGSCIYSTLLFIIRQANKMNIPVPCVTFDQPFWLKATGIIKDANLDIVCRLGGFHILMSFLGSLGGIMKGSGLEELFGEVYAENSVVHIIAAGEAVSRALRAHFLTESALMTLIVDKGIVDANTFTVVLNTFSESPMEIKKTLAADEFSKLTEAVADTKR